MSVNGESGYQDLLDKLQDSLDATQAALAASQARCAELGALAMRRHYQCEDCWYSCPRSPEGSCNSSYGDKCNCGTDEHNAKVNALLATGGGKG